MQRTAIPLFLLVAVFTACQQTSTLRDSGKIKVAVSKGILQAELPRIHLSEVRPGVSLLVGAEEKLFDWSPEGLAPDVKSKRFTPAGQAVDLTLTWQHPDGYSLSWSVCRLLEQPGFTIRSSLTNHSPLPVRLVNFKLCQTPENGLVCEGDPASWWLLPAMDYSRQAGNLAQIFPSEKRLQEQNVWGYDRIPDDNPRNEDGRWRIFQDALSLYSDTDRSGLVMGAVGPAVSYVQFNCRVDSGRIQLEILSQMDEIVIDPGETRQSEEVLILARPYQEALTTLFSWIAETHGARAKRDPVFGWCSWYDRYFDIDAAHIDGIVETVKAHRDRMPMDVIQIDAGWSKSFGDWQANEKFPHGVEPLVEKIRQAGAIPGIWMAPVVCDEKKPGDWFQKSGGNLLDPTHPDVEKFIIASIQQMMEAGFRYYKFDYNSIENYRPYNPKMTKFEIMRHLFSLYRQAIGEESFMLACGATPRPIVGLTDANRVGWDTLARWKSYPLADDGLPTLPTDIFDGIFNTALTALMNDILFICDPDVSYMLPRATSHIWQAPKETFIPQVHGLKWSGLMSFHSYAGLLGGMAMVSEPLYFPEYGSRNALRMLEILHPPAPDKGWSMNGDIDPWGRQFGFVAERPWGRFASVVLWNKEDKAADLALNPEALQKLDDRFHLWSFWDEQYLGIADASFVAKNIKKHGCALLRLTEIPQQKNVPMVVGSNLHISMGSAELKNIEATATEMKIELTDAGAREGKIFIHSDRPLVVQKAVGCQAFVVTETKTIYALVVYERNPVIPNRIVLAVSDTLPVETGEATKQLRQEIYANAGFDVQEMSEE